MNRNGRAIRLARLSLVAVTLAAPASSAGPAVALRGVTVVDVVEGGLQPHQTVLIDGHRIVAVGPADTVAIAEGTRIVDASDAFVIPGLWDMHVHVFNNNSPRPPNTWYFPLMLANGVTGVRDMFVKPGAPAEQVHAWRRELDDGVFVGPRIGAMGTLVDGKPPVHNSDVVTTAAEARAFVARLRKADVDFVKVYVRLTSEAYWALTAAASEAGLYVAGHIPDAVSVRDASDAGQRSVEHLTGVHYACSTEDEALRAKRVPQALLAREIVATHDPERCAALYRRFAANRTWQVPTFVAFEPWVSPDPARLEASEGFRHTPSEVVAGWQGLREFLATAPAGRKREMAAFYALRRDIVREMYEAGVPLLAGTDVGNAYVYPGFSLLDELEELVDLGLPALAALQTATINPARYLERTDGLGTVAEGKLADLVLLDANPLEDIHNLRRIRAVVVNGRLFDRAELERMKREAREVSQGTELTPTGPEGSLSRP